MQASRDKRVDRAEAVEMAMSASDRRCTERGVRKDGKKGFKGRKERGEKKEEGDGDGDGDGDKDARRSERDLRDTCDYVTE